MQAALTGRGDHVFLASDRDRDNKAGFKVYISRVVGGEPLPPEEVDLYIEEGDVTDPAVRMDGFDLLFSTGSSEAGADVPESGYRLFRSTTREVVGYTDMTRWEDFKTLMGDIAWWIVLAAAALIALIYILEKWRDMTTLFHKCLAGSAVLHLAALLIAMLWLIAQQLEEEDAENQEVSVSIDALAEEELAMESVPEEIQLTETATNLESEKMEAEFGAPGFEEQEAQVKPEAAATVKEAVLVEAQPTMSDPTDEPITEPATESSLLSDLTDTALPEVDAPILEESDPTKPREVADTSEQIFEPEPLISEKTEKTESSELADAAVESAVNTEQVIEVHEPMPLAEAPKESVVEATVKETAEEVPEEAEPLESTVLSDLALTHFDDPTEVSLDEGNPQSDDAPADTSENEFEPEDAIATINSAPAQGAEAVADSAMESAADAAAVEASETGGGASAVELVAANIGSVPAADSTVPTTDLDPGGLGGLPELALADPGAPTLEEADPEDSGAPANPADDIFTPDQSAPSLTTAPVDTESVSDSALATQADTAAVTGGELVAGSPVIESRPPELTASAPAESIPPSGADPAQPGSLPESSMVDLGAPVLEEGDPVAGAPANTSAETFTPGGAAQNLATTRVETSAVADTAASAAGEPTAVERGGMVADSAVSSSRPPERAGSAPATDIPPTKIDGGLPELSLVDTGAPQLDEGGAPTGAPADTSREQFTPGGSVPSLETAQASGGAVSDSAVADPTGAAAVAEARRDTAGGSALAHAPLQAAGSLPDLDGSGTAAELTVSTPIASLLPEKLEVDRELDPKGMATVIQKQRGKPGIETIKQMGGSDGTEKAISAAIEWLVKNQEKDGRWDTGKHGAKEKGENGARINYDNGGTGLVLLCFYGWGERHDRPSKYQTNVKSALDWLLKQQDENGYLGETRGRMYSHAIATIALCEAYGLTRDARLKAPAERAIAYSLAAQSKGRGGWRYSPGRGVRHLGDRLAVHGVAQRAHGRARGARGKLRARATLPRQDGGRQTWRALRLPGAWRLLDRDGRHRHVLPPARPRSAEPPDDAGERARPQAEPDEAEQDRELQSLLRLLCDPSTLPTPGADLARLERAPQRDPSADPAEDRQRIWKLGSQQQHDSRRRPRRQHRPGDPEPGGILPAVADVRFPQRAGGGARAEAAGGLIACPHRL